MKTVRYKQFTLLLLLGIMAVGCVQSQEDKATDVAGYDNIDVAEFDKLRQNKKYTVIDVRSPEECAEGMVDGALQMDFFSEDFEDQLKSLDPKKRYLMYCRSGRRRGKASKIMVELGFKHVSNLEGGYLEWSEVHNK